MSEHEFVADGRADTMTVQDDLDDLPAPEWHLHMAAGWRFHEMIDAKPGNRARCMRRSYHHASRALDLLRASRQASDPPSELETLARALAADAWLQVKTTGDPP